VSPRFTLLRRLGQGAMGVVWQARDEESGSIVALKLLREVYADDPEYRGRFERELELARRVHSPHVVQVLGYGTREGTPYLALEYVDGPSLRERLAEHGPYPWPEARALLVQLAAGLADAHAAGILHRDVKPSNVLLASDGTAKLTDFGIARGLDLTRVTGTSTLLGTPAYLAPEGPLDARSDLYALGVIAYELLAGAPPFEGPTYQAVILAHIRTPPDLAKLPPEARSIVGWCLAKDPAERPQSAAELLAVLQGEGRVPAIAPPRPAPAGTTPPSRPRPGPALVGLAALGLVVVTVGSALAMGGHLWAAPALGSPSTAPGTLTAALATRSPTMSASLAQATSPVAVVPGVAPTPAPTPRPTPAPAGATTPVSTGHTLSGFVTGPTGAGQASIGVQACDWGRTFGLLPCEPTVIAVTQANGSYSLSLPAGRYSVMFSDPTNRLAFGWYAAAGFTIDVALSTRVLVSRSVTGLDVRLPVAYSIAGTVLNVAGRTVQIGACPPSGLACNGGAGAVARNGRYRLVGLGPGSWKLKVCITQPSGLCDFYWLGPGGSAVPAASATVPASSASVVGIADSDRTGIDIALP
jgi:serine/threonine-protein kinase